VASERHFFHAANVATKRGRFFRRGFVHGLRLARIFGESNKDCGDNFEAQLAWLLTR